MKIAVTFFGPIASVASAATAALSIPPDTATTTRVWPDFAVSSRRNATSIRWTSASSMRSGERSFGSGLSEPSRSGASATSVASRTSSRSVLHRHAAGAHELRDEQIGTLVADDRVAVALPEDEIGVDVGHEQLLLELLRASD